MPPTRGCRRLSRWAAGRRSRASRAGRARGAWSARVLRRRRGFLALRGARGRSSARDGAVVAHRRAQHGERACRDRRRASCRRAGGALHRGAAGFQGIARRMQLRGEVDGVRVYDDFAHHPTAIATTLDGLRRRVGAARIVAVLEPRSNTMRMGVHQHTLARRSRRGRGVALHSADLGWDAAAVLGALGGRGHASGDVDALARELAQRRASRRSGADHEQWRFRRPAREAARRAARDARRA